MSFRFIIGFVILLAILFVTFDLYSYGIQLKRAPLLVTNPLLVIQAHYQVGGSKDVVRLNCPEIAQFRFGSPYRSYEEIPIEEWNKCIANIAPTSLVRDSCLEAEFEAKRLLDDINSRNELILGLEKFGIRFSPIPTYQRISNFADENACTKAVNGFALEKRIDINFKPSALLDAARFSEGVSEIDQQKLLKITSQQFAAENAFQDYRITAFIVLSGIFIFLLIVYSAYSRFHDGDSGGNV
ncbi:MAG: hypothetical protein ABH863_03315 [Candidatus Micrarchaeota archaeon]